MQVHFKMDTINVTSKFGTYGHAGCLEVVKAADLVCDYVAIHKVSYSVLNLHAANDK